VSDPALRIEGLQELRGKNHLRLRPGLGTGLRKFKQMERKEGHGEKNRGDSHFKACCPHGGRGKLLSRGSRRGWRRLRGRTCRTGKSFQLFLAVKAAGGREGKRELWWYEQRRAAGKSVQEKRRGYRETRVVGEENSANPPLCRENTSLSTASKASRCLKKCSSEEAGS